MADETVSSQIKMLRSSGVDDSDIIDSMSRHPVYGTRVKSALDMGGDPHDILESLANGPGGTPAPNVTSAGLVPRVGGAALDAFEGVGSGVASTLTGARDLVAKGYQKATAVQTPQGTQQPWGAVPDVPASLREAGTTPANAGTAFKVGKTAEQVGEFLLPGSAEAKLAEKAGDIFQTGKLARYANPVLESTTRTGAAAASAGTIRAVQTGGNKDEATKAAIMAGVFTAPFATVNAALKMVRPATLYAPESFRPFIEQRFLKDGRVDEIFQKAVDDNITISRSGLSKARGVHAKETAIRDAAIGNNAGTPVDTQTVYQPLRELQTIAQRFGETGVVNSINKRIAAVEASHGGVPAVPPSTMTVPGPNPQATLTPAGMPRTVQVPGKPAVPATITVNEAQDLKNFGQDLVQQMYSRVGGSVGAQKVREELSHGMMKAIEEVIPEVRQMNRNIQNTKIIRDAIEHYIESNPSLVNFKTMLWISLAPKTAGVSLLNLPRVRSALAVAAHNNLLSNIGSTGGKIVVGTDAASTSLPSMPVRPQ